MAEKVVIGLILCAFTYILWKIKDRTHNKPNPIRFWYVFTAYYWAVTVGCFLILPICLIRPKNVLNANVAAKIISNITRLLVRDIDFELRNGEILAEERGAVIIGNHQTSLDILGLLNKWDVMKRMAVVCKKELFYTGPFGLVVYLSGCVFVDRSKRKTAYKQIEETSKIMLNDKTKIFVFPEGTRHSEGKNFLPFKKGAFNMAVKAQVPIIPMVFSPYYFMDSKRHIFNKGCVIMQCLEPVPTAGLTMEDVPKLAEKLHEIMSTEYQRLAKEVAERSPSEYTN